MLGSEDISNLSPEDADRLSKMREDIRKGLTGAEYLTGLKSNVGNTFYDEHPAQAVATDLLSNSGKLGLGLAGLGIASNLRRQHKNLKMTEPARMSGKDDPKAGNNPKNILHRQKGGTREDISRVFGGADTNPQLRLERLDALAKRPRGTPGSLLDEWHNIHNNLAGDELTKAKNALLQKAMHSPEAASLERYADLYEASRRAEEQGGFKKYIGEGLHDVELKNPKLNKALNFIKEHFTPSANQAEQELAEKYKITPDMPHYDEELRKDIMREVGKGKNLKPGQPKISSPKSSTARRLLSQHGIPLLAGTGVALGGMGLAKLLKAIQNRAYSEDERKDWERTRLKSLGKFDEANRL